MLPDKLTVDPNLLEVLGRYELRKSVDSVGDDELRVLIDQCVQCLKHAHDSDLDALFKQSMNVDMHRDDIDDKVLKYLRDFSDLIGSNSFGANLGVDDPAETGYNKRIKLRRKVLIDNFYSAVLRGGGRHHTQYVDRGRSGTILVVSGWSRERPVNSISIMSWTRTAKAN
ncbi:hypothetical protein PHMEG_00016994 [Phytophthora megakarya]|uniref:Uncharacterized protein n=1 Tax=Phytophthora megakarya TaxID=4795 RepID=A0A225VXL8_9STRA|nr:hypothetical protein PHMEG_00016994 [Phytophthora megakarya]